MKDFCMKTCLIKTCRKYPTISYEKPGLSNLPGCSRREKGGVGKGLEDQGEEYDQAPGDAQCVEADRQLLRGIVLLHNQHLNRHFQS